MKKVIFSLAIVGLVFASSCNKDDDKEEKSCTELAASFETSFQTFLDNPDDSAACADYKSSTQAYIDAECITGENAASLQASLNAIDCSML